MKQCEGQIELTDYLKSKIVSKEVMELTDWINSQGKSQYEQIGEVIGRFYEQYKDSDDMLGRLTNAVSVWVLEQSIGYMKYLVEQSEV